MTGNRYSMKLRSVAVAGREEHAPLIIAGQPTSGHPDTSTHDGVCFGPAFHSKGFDVGSGIFIPSHDPASEVVLDAMRCEACIDVRS